MSSVLLIALIKEAPELVAKVIALLHAQGKVTAEELANFLGELSSSSGASFFPSLPKP